MFIKEPIPEYDLKRAGFLAKTDKNVRISLSRLKLGYVRSKYFCSGLLFFYCNGGGYFLA